MTTEGSTENESRYRNLIKSILRERLLFRNPGRFGLSNKGFRHQDVLDLDVSAPKKLRHFLVLVRNKTYLSSYHHHHIHFRALFSSTEGWAYTNLNGSKYANIVHVVEIHVCYSIHPSILCRNILVPKHFGTETSRGI